MLFLNIVCSGSFNKVKDTLFAKKVGESISASPRSKYQAKYYAARHSKAAEQIAGMFASMLTE